MGNKRWRHHAREEKRKKKKRKMRTPSPSSSSTDSSSIVLISLNIFIHFYIITIFKIFTVHGFLRQMEHFLTDMSNRVEHQNGRRVMAVWVRFGVQLGLRQTPALIIIYTMH